MLEVATSQACAQTHPMGYSEWLFGYWHTNPRSLNPFAGNGNRADADMMRPPGTQCSTITGPLIDELNYKLSSMLYQTNGCTLGGNGVIFRCRRNVSRPQPFDAQWP